MKYIVCPDCKKKSPFQEKYAGRKIKCSCGNSFRCLIDLEEKIDQSISNRNSVLFEWCQNCTAIFAGKLSEESVKRGIKVLAACGV